MNGMESFINIFDDESDLFTFDKANLKGQEPLKQVSMDELFDDDETQIHSSKPVSPYNYPLSPLVTLSDSLSALTIPTLTVSQYEKSPSMDLYSISASQGTSQMTVPPSSPKKLHHSRTSSVHSLNLERLDDVLSENYLSPYSAFSEGYLSPNIAVSEGYLSPSSAYVDGMSPLIVPVPDYLIQSINSPMTADGPMSPFMGSIAPTSHQNKVWQSNKQGLGSGLGLARPMSASSSQETLKADPSESSFENMLQSLGLLPDDVSMNSINSQVMSENIIEIQKKPHWNVVKTERRTLYQCPFDGCGKTFTRPYNLKSHYRGHTGERPYECEECKLTFTRKHDLKRHEKLHQGIKPFVCQGCDKAFARSDALKRHLKKSDNGKESACLLKMKLDELVSQSTATASSS